MQVSHISHEYSLDLLCQLGDGDTCQLSKSVSWRHSEQPAYEQGWMLDLQGNVIVRDFDCQTVFYPAPYAPSHPNCHYVATGILNGISGQWWVWQGAMVVPPYAINQTVPQIPYNERWVWETSMTIGETLKALRNGHSAQLVADYEAAFPLCELTYRLHDVDSFAYYLERVVNHVDYPEGFHRPMTDKDRQGALERLQWLSARVNSPMLAQMAVTDRAIETIFENSLR
jgi:hypothetical protein